MSTKRVVGFFYIRNGLIDWTAKVQLASRQKWAICIHYTEMYDENVLPVKKAAAALHTAILARITSQCHAAFYEGYPYQRTGNRLFADLDALLAAPVRWR